ncbi:MAG: endonuclease Q family protein [Nanoarchaeota archaeon]|nr:endonuclease Q family protein [Nanoarchaeota archaeon]
MEVIADLQIHSKYARATSKNISIENLEKWARIKGLDLLGVGDFQHPLRRKEIDEKLTEDEHGILRTSSNSGVAFLWQTEVSLMYSQDGKRRAVHLLVFAPNTNIANKITEFLGSKGRLDYDGRPIFGMSAVELVRELKKIDDKIEIIPAHCMTPWFGLFGSKSGFDSLKDCFQDETDKIYAIESGMSADPAMLWRLEEVAGGKVNVVSFSDAHSFWPWRMGREATIFGIPELTYENIIKAIRTGIGLKATIETPPEYGKYHWDGHRNCDFSCGPEKTRELNGICPVCKKPMIIGVEYRIDEIAKYPLGFEAKNSRIYYKLLPLHEVIALATGNGMNTTKVWSVYNSLIMEFGNEFNLLLKVPKEKIAKFSDEKLADLILKNREGKIKVKPGYDGEYGVAQIGEKQVTL